MRSNSLITSNQHIEHFRLDKTINILDKVDKPYEAIMTKFKGNGEEEALYAGNFMKRVMEYG